MMNMENKNKITVSSLIAIVLLLIMVAGASFAYFGSFKQDVNSTANINVTTQKGFNTTFTSSSAPLELHATLANMIASTPGSVVAESNVNLNVSLALGGTGTTYKCLYDIVYEYDSNSDVYGSETVPRWPTSCRSSLTARWRRRDSWPPPTEISWRSSTCSTRE